MRLCSGALIEKNMADLMATGQSERKAGGILPLDALSRWAANVTDKRLPGGRLFHEDAPNAVLTSIHNFFRRTALVLAP